MVVRAAPTSLVIDLGADTLRVGHAGEENPTTVLSSVIGAASAISEEEARWFPLHPAVASARLEARSCLRYGEQLTGVADDASPVPELDLDAFEALLNLSIGKLEASPAHHHSAKRLRRDILQPLLGFNAFEESPVLLSEPNSRCSKMREAMAELLFEKFDTPALSCASSAALSCFSFGRTAGLVLDIGAGITSVAPVHSGEVFSQALREVRYAGTALSLSLLHVLKGQGIEISPVFPGSAADPKVPAGISASHWRYEALRLTQDMKESICFCSHVPLASADPKEPYPHELPDGQKVDVATFSCKVPEKLLTGDSSVDSVFRGAPSLLAESLSICSEQVQAGELLVQRDLVGAIMLVGGSSHFVNFKTRLEASLWGDALSGANLQHLARRVKVHFAKERRHSAWLGGSVLGELGSFGVGSRWLTRKDYHEHGPSILSGRCQ